MGLIGDFLGNIADNFLFSAKKREQQNRAHELELESIQKQYEYQSQLNKEQNAFTERMWNESNEYNTPTNQLQRYIDAGINPNAAINSVLGQSNNAGLISASSGGSINADFAGADASAQQSAVLQQRLDAEIHNLESSSKLNENEAKGVEIGNFYKPAFMQLQINEMRSNIDKIGADVDLINKNIDLIQSQTEGQIIENFFKTQLNEKNLSLISSQIDEVYAKISNLRSSIFTNVGHLANESQRVAIEKQLMNNTIRLTNKQMELMSKTGLKIDHECDLLAQQLNIAYVEEDFKKAEQIASEFRNHVNEINGADYYASNIKWQNTANLVQSYTQSFHNVAGGVSDVVSSIFPNLSAFRGLTKGNYTSKTDITTHQSFDDSYFD